MTWRCGSCGGDNPGGTRFCGNCGAPASATSGAAAVAARLPEQLRLVTALFADLSGFTSLSEKLDPETLSEIIGEAIRTLSEVVDRFGGTVLNYAGDAVLAGFGIPESSGDDAERAMAAALEMRSALAELLPSLPPIAAGLTLHIGLNSGHAVARYTGASGHIAYTLVGDAVNTAQRLEAAAPSDEIYVGPLTAELAGRRFVLEPVGPLTMKGKAEPMSAFRLVAKRADSVRVRNDGTAALVGRDELLRTLAAMGTEPRIVALVGEPGIGKTAAVQDALGRADGVRWAIASAVPYDAAPYGVWRTIARQLGDGEALVAAAFATDQLLAGDPQQTVASASTRNSPTASSDRQRTIHRAVLEAVRRAAPVVVVVDDLQWADPASLELARELAYEIGLSVDGPASPGDVAGPASPPVVAMVLTARPEGRRAVESLLAEVPAALGSVHQVEGLDSGEIAHLISALLGGPPNDELVALIVERTGGSPFFATELVRLLHDQDRVIEVDDEWRLVTSSTDPDVPPSVEELVQGRLDKLDSGARSTIELASVIGQNISLELLRGASLGTSTVAALEPLVDAGLLIRDPLDRRRLSFRHGIVRDVAYRCTLRQTRRRLHHQVAHALGVQEPGAFDRLTEIALHLYEADAGLEAVGALRSAAAHAAGLYANESAVDLLDKAIALAQRGSIDRDVVNGLHDQRAAINELLARYDDALGDYSLVADNGASESSRAAANVGKARVLTSMGRHGESLEILGRFDGADPQLAIARSSVLLNASRFADARDQAARGLERQPRAPERTHLLLFRAQALAGLGLLPEALIDAADAALLADETGQRHAQVKALRVLGGIYVDSERPHEAVDVLRRGVELAAKGGARFEEALCLMNLARVEQILGNLPVAIELDRRCAETMHRIGSTMEAAVLGNLAHKLIDATHFSEARLIAERSSDLAEHIEDGFTRADAEFALGRIAFAQGDAAAARRRFEHTLQLLEEIGTTQMVDEVKDYLSRSEAIVFAHRLR